MFRAVGQSRPAKGGLREESLAVMTRVIRAFNHVTPRVITKKKKKIKRSFETRRENFTKEKFVFSFLIKFLLKFQKYYDEKKISEIYNTPGINQNSKLLLIYCCSKRRNTYIDNSSLKFTLQ